MPTPMFAARLILAGREHVLYFVVFDGMDLLDCRSIRLCELTDQATVRARDMNLPDLQEVQVIADRGRFVLV